MINYHSKRSFLQVETTSPKKQKQTIVRQSDVEKRDISVQGSAMVDIRFFKRKNHHFKKHHIRDFKTLESQSPAEHVIFSNSLLKQNIKVAGETIKEEHIKGVSTSFNRSSQDKKYMKVKSNILLNQNIFNRKVKTPRYQPFKSSILSTQKSVTFQQKPKQKTVQIQRQLLQKFKSRRKSTITIEARSKSTDINEVIVLKKRNPLTLKTDTSQHNMRFQSSYFLNGLKLYNFCHAQKAQQSNKKNVRVCFSTRKKMRPSSKF